jgi:hypothetical protein
MFVTAVHKSENCDVHLKGDSVAIQHCAERRWLQNVCKEPYEYGMCKGGVKLPPLKLNSMV